MVRVDAGHGPPVELARQAPWTTADHRLRAGDELRVGSNTKTMVLQLVGEKRLGLADLRPRPWTAEQLLAAGTRHPALFPPGETWSYSNTNYVALGLVLEKATGKTLPTLFRQRIIEPLGLKDTYYGAPDRRPGTRRAHRRHGDRSGLGGRRGRGRVDRAGLGPVPHGVALAGGPAAGDDDDDPGRPGEALVTGAVCAIFGKASP
ncbi:beta-lactamase family protein [Amycolatopsis sp. NBC_01307]|uniref:serine hydrolase domain-containing protein n=1 Tax=Amycolatopsis sp. NBC_01307 TaxID=2903561 RepID=UPI002E12925F|nr:beta-lactamase family protein [Amycolatopsis sp. NBC_01307]